MDPFIESCGLWEDFHTHLIEKIYDALAEIAPEGYAVRTGERSYVVLVQSDDEQSHSFIPDVGITLTSRLKSQTDLNPKSVVAESAGEFEPIEIRPFIEEEYRETFVEIRTADTSQRLVTTIEVLSPSNKRQGSQGWNLYARKRQGILLSDVHLVEIDLLRGGQRMPMVDPWPTSPYVFLVARQYPAKNCKAWPAFALRPLPSIPVPLAKPDPDLMLDLQPMVEAIYRRSRYFLSIDYTKPPVPPLQPQESDWLKEQPVRLTAANQPNIPPT